MLVLYRFLLRIVTSQHVEILGEAKVEALEVVLSIVDDIVSSDVNGITINYIIIFFFMKTLLNLNNLFRSDCRKGSWRWHGKWGRPILERQHLHSFKCFRLFVIEDSSILARLCGKSSSGGDVNGTMTTPRQFEAIKQQKEILEQGIVM